MRDFIVKYWLEFVFTGAITVLSIAIKNIVTVLKKEMTDQACIRHGVQAILRDRIIQAYNQYTEKGYCAIHDRDNLSNLYLQYHTLGANGVIDGLVEEIFKLPVINELGKTTDRSWGTDCGEREVVNGGDIKTDNQTI